MSLNFYKNNAIHCFVIPSIVVLSFLQTVKKRKGNSGVDRSFYGDFLACAMNLRNFLKFEFFFSPRAVFAEELNRTLNFFAPGTNWENGSVSDWIEGFHQYFRDWDEITVYSAMLGELLDSYCAFMKYLKLNPGMLTDKKQLSSSAIRFAQDLNQRGQLNYPESISLQNFSNCILSLENKGFFSPESDQTQGQFRVMPWNFDKENMLREIQEFLSTIAEKPTAILGY